MANIDINDKMDLESSDHLLSIDLASKAGSGTGIAVCQLRGIDSSIVNANNRIYNMNIMNWLNTYTDRSSWVVCGVYPDIVVFNSSDQEMIQKYYGVGSKIFDRRIDAEKNKLERIMTYIINLNAPASRYWPKIINMANCHWVSEENKIIYIKAKYTLDNLEEEHPEWLI